MTWATIIAALLSTATTVYALALITSTFKERKTLLDLLAQAKLEAAAAIADKARAEGQTQTAQEALYERITRDTEANQRALENATASDLAEQLRRKLSKGRLDGTDPHSSSADGGVAAPVQVDPAADTARSRAPTKP